MDKNRFLSEKICESVIQNTTSSVLSSFSDSYFLFLEREKSYYTELLKNYFFNYTRNPAIKNFGNDTLNKEVSGWLAWGLEEFLENTTNYVSLNDQILISKTSLNSTFYLFVNNEAFRDCSKSNFFKYGETINLFQRSYFNSVLSNATSVMKFHVKDLKDKERAYFKHKGLKDYDVVFSKLDLMKSFSDVKEEKNNETRKSLSFLTLESVEEKNSNFSHEGRTQVGKIYEALPSLKKRKEEGKILTYDQGINEIKKFNMIANNGSVKRDFLMFLKTEQGKKFLTYGGPITSPFIRTVNNLSDVILSFYKKNS